MPLNDPTIKKILAALAAVFGLGFFVQAQGRPPPSPPPPPPPPPPSGGGAMALPYLWFEWTSGIEEVKTAYANGEITGVVSQEYQLNDSSVLEYVGPSGTHPSQELSSSMPVFIGVGGDQHQWRSYVNLFKSPSLSQNFANDLVSACVGSKARGAVLDFEPPGNSPSGTFQAYVNFVNNILAPAMHGQKLFLGVIGPSWDPNFWDWTYAYEMGGADWLLDMVYTSDNQLFESTILSHSKGIVGKYLGGLCNRCTGATNDPSYCLDALASLGAAGTFVWSVPISQSWYEDLKAYIGGGKSPPPPPPPSSIPEFYAVKSGDTVYKISQAFGVSISEIMALNPQIPRAQTTWSAYLILPGEPIEIKSLGDADPSAIYIAVKGDYVYKIAQNYKLTVSELLALNPQIPSAMKTVQAYEIWVNEIVRLRQ